MTSDRQVIGEKADDYPNSLLRLSNLRANSIASLRESGGGVLAVNRSIAGVNGCAHRAGARVMGGRLDRVERAIEMGFADEPVTPRETRRRLAKAFAVADTARGHHGDIPL